MHIRINTLWRIPVYCMVSGWISFYLTVYFGGSFFGVQTPGPDGTISLSIDPMRSLFFHGILFLAILLLGGLWLFRDMTRTELAVSAGLTSIFYLTIALLQLYAPDLLRPFTITLSKIQNWYAFLTSLLMQCTDNFMLTAFLPNFAPFLFVFFGRNRQDT